MPTCQLCNAKSTLFYKDEFYKCSCCKAIFRPKEKLLDNKKEKQRYDNHTNNANDSGYQNFVKPITNSILNEFKSGDMGLDFGCGKDSPIIKILEENNYKIAKYDIFFHNDKKAIEQKYDYIACCEVIEHFYNPKKEFELLKSLLKKDGVLYLMTGIYSDEMDFSKWWYKNDLTHVFIYTKETLYWIKKEFDFKDIKIEKNFIRLNL
jgi:SAM-dependent methyltransferase